MCESRHNEPIACIVSNAAYDHEPLCLRPTLLNCLERRRTRTGHENRAGNPEFLRRNAIERPSLVGRVQGVRQFRGYIHGRTTPVLEAELPWLMRLLHLKEVLTVVCKLTDRLHYVLQRTVRGLFTEPTSNVGRPSQTEFLDGADVQIPIVEVLL